MLLAQQSCSSLWDARYWCFGFARKAFLFIIFLIIKVHLRNETNLDTYNNLHSVFYWQNNHVLHIGIDDIDALDLPEELFFPPFSSWNGTNLDTLNNLHSFCHCHSNHVLLIGIYDINALNSQEKLFFPPFSLQKKFIHEIRQTWILVVISTILVIGTTIMFSVLGYMILMHWICMKSFSFHHFLYN